MPANTPNGWPYVLPADNVADYPVTSQGLAGKADAAVPFAYCLTKFDMSVGASASYDRAVTFPAGLFTQAPIVLMTKQNSAAAKWGLSAISIAVTGCTVRAQPGDGSTGGGALTLTVGFMAIQFSATSGTTPGVTLLAQEVDLTLEDDPDAVRLLLDRIAAAELAGELVGGE